MEKVFIVRDVDDKSIYGVYLSRTVAEQWIHEQAVAYVGEENAGNDDYVRVANGYEIVRRFVL